jgi:membrane-associated phospholipid phosphatase
MILKEIKYAIRPFFIVLVTLLITYFGNQYYAEMMNVTGIDYSYILINVNKSIPFISWTIYPYIISYPFWMLTFFVIAYYDEKRFYLIYETLVSTLIICGIWYFLFQSDVEFWRTTSGLFIDNNYLIPISNPNFTEKIVLLIYSAAGPRNALPSMHVLISWISIIAVRKNPKVPLIWKTIIITLSVCIIVSTQTLKQHYIIDLIVAVFLGDTIYRLYHQYPRLRLIKKFKFSNH